MCREKSIPTGVAQKGKEGWVVVEDKPRPKNEIVFKPAGMQQDVFQQARAASVPSLLQSIGSSVHVACVLVAKHGN